MYNLMILRYLVHTEVMVVNFAEVMYEREEDIIWQQKEEARKSARKSKIFS